MSNVYTDLTTANRLAVNSGYDYKIRFQTFRDLSNKDVYFKIKNSQNASDFAFEIEKTSDPQATGLLFVDEAQGEFFLHITDTSSAGHSGTKVYECYYKEADGKHLIAQGQIQFFLGAIH